MRTMWWSFVFSMFLVIILRCSGDNPTRFKEGDFAYPLKVGHTWEYTRESSTFNFRSQDTEIIRSDTTTFSNVFMEIVGIDTEGMTTEQKRLALREHREGQYEKLIDAVYKRRGWDTNGIPTLDTVRDLGIDYPDVVELIERHTAGPS